MIWTDEEMRVAVEQEKANAKYQRACEKTKEPAWKVFLVFPVCLILLIIFVKVFLFLCDCFFSL